METPIKNEPRPSMTAIPIPRPRLPKHIADEPTITMVFPRALSLNLDNYMGRVDFDKGLQEVPVSLENHWYLVQQGVARYAKPEEPKPDPAAMARQLEEAGYKVTPPANDSDIDEIEDEEVAAPVRMEPTKPAKRAKNRG